MERLYDLDLIILDALRHRPHPTHSSIEKSTRLAEKLRAKLAVFTHISPELGHEETEANLPGHIRLAYDGMRIELPWSDPSSAPHLTTVSAPEND
jgi:phosphoribosyl 1,2-cyclic phosphate phosphodiesterase